MIFEQLKFVVPVGMQSTTLNNLHSKKTAPNHYPSQTQAFPKEYLKKQHLGKASPAFENDDYGNFYASPQGNGDNLPKDGNFYIPEGANIRGTHQGQYYEDQFDEPTAATNPDGVFNEPSNEFREPSLSRTIGYSGSQKSRTEKSLPISANKDLLQIFQAQHNLPNPKARAGGVKSRGSILYKNLNLLMKGNNLKNAVSLNKNSNLQNSLQDSPEPQQKPYQSSNHMEMAQSLEAINNPQVRLPKSNSILNSLVKIEKQISSKIKIEKITSGDRKRSKRFWDAERDAQLQSFIKVYGQDWSAIAQAFNDPEITPELAKERYNSRISPQISKARFSLQEDQLIAQYYTTFGPNWKRITAHLPGRTETMVRNRFYSSIKKKQFSSFFQNKTLENIADVSPVSSENKVTTQTSFESNSKYDDLSEKCTGKFSETEVNSGSTAASSILKKKLTNMKNNLKTKIESAVTSLQNQVKIPTVDLEQWENGYETSREGTENLNSGQVFAAAPLQLDKKFEQSNADAFIDSAIKPFEQDFWDPYDFGNDNNKESHDLIGFDKFSIFNDNEIFQNQNLNSVIPDNIYENFLNFGGDNHAPQMEEESRHQFLGSNFYHNKDQFPKQEQIVQPNVPSAQLNQLESLLMQIKSIEQLFDRTKQEINLLQNRFTTR